MTAAIRNKKEIDSQKNFVLVASVPKRLNEVGGL
jgi:hypothetical protein